MFFGSYSLSEIMMFIGFWFPHCTPTQFTNFGEIFCMAHSYYIFLCEALVLQLELNCILGLGYKIQSII